ncbi:MAG: HAMP domain-containing protein [Cyanosarcina radialis HA8281-LM2]|jgi:methyl-accepting chemotaxis protein|nr:HAMP domain-containing protein [Cyanosarcina radialis HA8281-LM2]
MVPSSQPNSNIPDLNAQNEIDGHPNEALEESVAESQTAEDLQASGVEGNATSDESIVEAQIADDLPKTPTEGDYPFDEAVAYDFDRDRKESELELEEINSDGQQPSKLDPAKLDWEAQKAIALKTDTPRLQLQGLSLKTKATALAIALSAIPVLGIGAIAYYLTNQSLTQEIIQGQKYQSSSLEDKVEAFIQERYANLQLLSELDTFANARIRQATTQQQKDALLTRYVKTNPVYDRIAVIDLNGNVLGQSSADRQLDKNHLQNSKFLQKVIETQSIIIGNPYKSGWTGKWSLEMAAPIKDDVTGQISGIIRTRINLEAFNELFESDETKGQEFFFFDDRGTIFLSERPEAIGKNLKEFFPQLATEIERGKENKDFTKVERNLVSKQEELRTYTTTEDLAEEPYNLNWGGVISQPTDVAFAPQRQLLLSMLLGTALTAIAVGALATFLANRATRPLVEATEAVQKLGKGEFDTVVPVKSDDEIGVLASNINQMSSQIQVLLSQQQSENERSQLLKDITLKLSQFPQVEQILNTAVEEMRFALKTDRVIVYEFNKNWLGNIIAESVADGYPRALGASIDDPCFREHFVERYRQGRVQATANIYEAGLTECHLQQLEPFEVKANLVAPIVVGSNRQLLGLLIAHQCDAPRNWDTKDIDLFSQLATQVGFALDRVNLLEKQKSEKERLQRRALELLMQVDPVSQGDLTIRADVTEDEIGTIADSYNATIGSLRKIVAQVQTAARKMAATTSSNEVSVRELSQEALQQTTEINDALDRIQDMTNSIEAVARSAAQAEAAAQEATATVAAGDEAINRTVDGILAIRKTVSTTAKKVQQLGEASQKISKVIGLINSFADQTNLLALNAAIEAARAGEEGRGFAVVADEVGVLARQSSEATAEIESIVQEIQAETRELVAAMESGSKQVVEGTKLAQETRISLSKITQVSDRISELVKGIAQAAVAQSHASQVVAKTMTDVAATSTKTSDEATQVSDSFKELLAVAEELQASASQFKVS